jgi:inhibitor of KinA
VSLLWLGDRGITLQLEQPDPEAVLGIAEALQEMIARGELPGATEVLPAMRSVSLYFDPLTAEPEKWDLPPLLSNPPRRKAAGRLRTVPVCFDADFSPDLPGESFITAFLAAPVSVRMLGFLPGFAYLGDLPEELRIPRLATPRKVVPAGSLAVANAYCAIYPWESPGGWNLIGRTPISLFDATNAEHPTWFEPGDQVRWQRIDRTQFEDWPS